MQTQVLIFPAVGIGDLKINKPRSYNRLKAKNYDNVESIQINAHPMESDIYLGGAVRSCANPSTGIVQTLYCYLHKDFSFKLNEIDVHRDIDGTVEFLLNLCDAKWIKMHPEHYPSKYLFSSSAQILYNPDNEFPWMELISNELRDEWVIKDAQQVDTGNGTP